MRMKATRWLLMPLSGLYAGAVYARNFYYDHVPTAVRRAAVPVISVGNLTVGGTGKTPFVIEVVRRLRALGQRPAILTRGYHAAPGESADEVREFQEAAPEVPVVVNPDRVAGAARAVAEHAADCVVLDDGFQHRRLGRDLDIVLIDALAPWGNGALLPAGRLREPRKSLRRADVFVITRANQVEPAATETIAARLRTYDSDKLILWAGVEAEALVDRAGRRRPPADLAGRCALPVCGLGNPRTFTTLLDSLTSPVYPPLVFADHARYGRKDVDRIIATARRAGADVVVTTRKDWVKLAPRWSEPALDLLRLDVRVALPEGAQELDARLRQVVRATAEPRAGRTEQQR
jgi:tetraacyldisaccharide 4'-kinase